MEKKADSLPDILKEYIGTTLKKKLIELAVGQIRSRLFSMIPFLAGGILGKIASHFITKGVIFLMDQTIIGAHIGYIYFDEHFDRKKVEKIIIKLIKNCILALIKN